MLNRTRRRGLLGAAGLVSVAMVLAACSSSSSSGSSSPSATNTDPACAPYASYGSFPGTTVTVFTSILPPEQQKFEESWAQFSKCTGITVKYEGSDQFEAQLPTRIQGGNAPDIAFIPQPGLLAKLVQQGGPVAAPQGTVDNVTKLWNSDWKNYGTVDGTFYAAPLGANVKSFVWYSPTAFADKGYEVPTTWADLLALSEKMAAEGGDVKPWCAGIESGDATGWPATDWVEDVMLRTAGAETYDKWVNHEIPFNDPAVATALAEVGKILKNDKFVNGGFGDVKTIASTSFQDAGQPILDGTCYMHRQASFYAANWPEGTEVGPEGEVWAFYLPSVDSSTKPVLGGGEFTAAFADRPEVKAFQTYLSSVEWADERAKTCGSGGCVTANKNADPSLLKNPVDKLSAEALTDEAATFRFDGSDLMPGAVGAGTFWKGMTDWIALGTSSQEVLTTIENSWPAS